MRFYAHDGKSTHGPAGIDELLKLPGFDGDTLVCPVGSDDSADWKPALTYPPFKKALLDALAAVPAPQPPPPAPLPLPPAPMELPKAAEEPAKPDQPPVPAPFPLPLPALPVPLPLPPAAAAPPPAAKTAPCPRCAHANLEDARFCNSCGARMDGRLEDISSPPPSDLPPAPAPAPFAPLDEPKAQPEPAFDPFGPLDPMLTYPEAPAAEPPPAPVAEPSPAPAAEPAPAAAPSPAPPVAPEIAPAAAAVPVWKRPAVLAAFVGAAVVASGLAYMALSKGPAPEAVAELNPAAVAMDTPNPSPAPAPEPASSDSAKPNLLYSTPPATSSPSMPPPRAAVRKAKPPKLGGPASSAPSTAAAKPKRARKPRPARAAKPEPKPEAAPAADPGGGETLIESRSPQTRPKTIAKRAAKAAEKEKDPLLEALLTDATQPAAEALAEPGAEAAAKTAGKAPPAIGQRPAAKPAQFTLPGLQRPVSASGRAPDPAPQSPAPPSSAPASSEPEAEPVHIAGLDSPALGEPGKPSPPPGIEDEPVKSAEGDQLALVQVHEQFDFCSQLLAQGAYGDHYDTCLCKDTREAAPYRGRRGFYVTAKKKEANAGHLETTAKILKSRIDGGVATVTARWKSSPSDKGRSASQSWKLEDGLWCQAP